MIALDANGADGGRDTVEEGGRRSGVPFELFDSPVWISNEEEPVRAVRSKPDASIVQAAKAVAAGRAAGVVSAGSTGAMLAACTLHIKRMKGVHRPAVALLLPLPGRPTLLLDVGANVEVRPEHLVQFAYMGAAFMEAVHDVDRPAVGLLNIGEEPNKGGEDLVAAHERLSGGPLNFIGNVEGTALVAGAADVVVTDGFTGNVALKTMEGTAKAVTGAIRDAIRSGTISSLGGLLVRGRLGRLRREIDPNTTGGAMLLGLRGVAVVAHGSSTADGIANALRLAQRAVDEHMIERTHRALEEAGVLRSATAASVENAHE